MAVQGGYRYYYMVHPRVLYPFLYQDAVQSVFQTDIYARLANLWPSYSPSHANTQRPDLETYAWDLLDSDMFQRLSIRKYVSMSRERRFNLPAASNVSMSNQALIDEIAEKFKLDPESSNSLAEYLKSPVLSGSATEPEVTFESVFEACTPGVLTLEQVRQEVNLDQWKMKYGNTICKLEVSALPNQECSGPAIFIETFRVTGFDDSARHDSSMLTEYNWTQNLATWEESEMSDTSTIKGIVAELAASIGPDLVPHTMLEFR
ncbi:hypothetical protein MMC07_008488 [Pseudocyphellaria aurata]|nr:hypothetical protein [Pseudocyphellaria aurata]